MPDEHPSSSYGANALGRTDPLLTPHAEYLALGGDPDTRTAAYRALFEEVVPEPLLQKIRDNLRQDKALGTNRFREWVEARTGQFASLRPVGRLARGSNYP